MNLYQLIQYIQKSKITKLHTISPNITKLSKEQQQSINIDGNGGGNIEISIDDISDMITDEAFIEGSYYLVTGCDEWLYGGTDILLRATSTNSLASKGLGKFYNPRYDNYPMFDPDGEYSEDDTVIYGGKVWVNNGGNDVGSLDIFSLDSGWTVMSFDDDTYYDMVWDEVEYSVDFNFVISRRDSVNRNFVANSMIANFWFWCDVRPIKVFRWGHSPLFSENGVTDCNINDSYINCLNFIDGMISGVTMSGYSYIYNVNLKNGAYMQSISVENGSYMYDLELDNTGLYNIAVTNESGVFAITSTNGSIYDISLNNDSQMLVIDMTESNMNGINVSNGSGIGWTNLTNCNLRKVNLTNESFMGDNDFTNAGVTSISLDESYLSNATLTNYCTLEFIYMRDASFNSFSLDNSSFLNMNLLGHTYSPGEIVSKHLLATDCSYNTIKYQFTLSLNGTEGNGNVGLQNIPFLFVPQNFFIEKISLSAATLVSAGAASIDVGFQNGSGIEGLMGDGTFESLSNGNSGFDLAMGSTSGDNATADTYLVMNVFGANITDGWIGMEVILKNNNYFSNNDE